MFVNCTFSLVAIHVFGFINANPLENHEDPALLISGVLKPVFTVSDWNRKFMLLKINLVQFCLHTDSGSVTASQPQQGVQTEACQNLI